MFTRRARAFLVAIGFAVVAATGGAFADQTAAEMVSPTQKVPREGYTTWTLFLICAPDWLSPDKSADLADLYHRFKRFGDAIGDANLADE
jgi:hypothetical protein